MTTRTEDGQPALWDALDGAEVLDLAQPMRKGMPQSPNHPPYRLTLEQRHGDRVRDDGGSMANELIITGGHVGTHIDAFAHVSHDGCLNGGVEASLVQDFEGFSQLGIESFAPFVGRAVVLDVAAVHGTKVLPAGYEVTVQDLEAAHERAGVKVRPGDALLIGTGWSRTWSDGEDFAGTVAGAPGPGPEAGRWLAAKRPTLVGGETIAFEHIAPGRGHSRLPVHTVLLVESGIHIMETMRLYELLDREISELVLVVAPLPLMGATGAPVRPLGLLTPGGRTDASA